MKTEKLIYEAPSSMVLYIKLEQMLCLSPNDENFNSDTDPAIVI